MCTGRPALWQRLCNILKFKKWMPSTSLPGKPRAHTSGRPPELEQPCSSFTHAHINPSLDEASSSFILQSISDSVLATKDRVYACNLGWFLADSQITWATLGSAKLNRDYQRQRFVMSQMKTGKPFETHEQFGVNPSLQPWPAPHHSNILKFIWIWWSYANSTKRCAQQLID